MSPRVLRLSGLRLSLSPVDQSAQLFWDIEGVGEVEVGLEAEGDTDDFALDSEADLIGTLASGEPVILRLVDARGSATWVVPPFVEAMLA